MSTTMPDGHHQQVALPRRPTLLEFLDCCGCIGDGVEDIHYKRLHERKEQVFYDSARAPRHPIGAFWYCMSCPMWTKITDHRIVHSTWDWCHPCDYNPCLRCCKGCDGCLCNPHCFHEWCRIPVGRTMDTFDADIIVDIGAHQNCFKICRNEGDLVIYRLPGGDMSHQQEKFTVPDVPRIFSVFDEMTYRLSKMNLKNFAARSLGRDMG